jgi:hypothetical protein
MSKLIYVLKNTNWLVVLGLTMLWVVSLFFSWNDILSLRTIGILQIIMITLLNIGLNIATKNDKQQGSETK